MNKSIFCHRRITHSFGIVCLIALPSLFAENDPRVDRLESAKAKPTYTRALKSARAPKADVLEQRLIENIISGTVVETQDGVINDHKLPKKLGNQFSYSPLRGDENDSLVNRSSVVPIDAPLVDISVEGVSSDDNVVLVGGRVTPPDTNGDVGMMYYVQYINLGWVILDKSTGSVVAGPFAGNTFWQGFGGACESQNAGDPTALYDQAAGRWIFSQFTGTSISDGHQCFAITDGEDPSGPYTLYDFVVSPGTFNDYPHFGVWGDGYYLITHEFTNPGLSFIGTKLTVLDRQAILSGDPGAGFVQFSNSTSGDDLEFGSMPSNIEGPNAPPASTCNFITHATDAQAFGIPGPDRIRFWEACVDFNVPGNSTLNQISSITIPEIDIALCNFNRNCIPQPGTSQLLDPNAANTSYRFNTRYFPGEGVLKGVVTRNVDVGGDRAGVFWAGIDIDVSTNATSISDGGDSIGIIDFSDGLNRWMGSASLDQDGNIGIGYTRSSASSFPSIYYTVHESGVDPAGAVQAETVCVDGSGSTTTANRWADYASTSMDPADGCTFWHTNEYVETTGSRQWNTRVCSFRIPSCGGVVVNQPPVASFTNNCTNLNCNFDASASNDPDGSIVSYSWIFDDGNSGNGVSPSNNYVSAGNYSVTLTVTDNDGATDSITLPVTATDPAISNCPAGSIDFNNFAMEAYSNQDNPGQGGAITVEDGGDTLHIVGNRWRRSTQSYTLTANTVVEFDYASGSQGEIHALGFDENQTLTDTLRLFEFFGTQNWNGDITFAPQYSGSGAFESFQIPIGASYTGNNFRLVLVNDKDAGTKNNEGLFRCVRVFEDTPTPVAPVASFTSNCTALSCSFDATASSDSDGSIVDYSWTLGDANNGSGVTPNHIYASANTYPVNLTVTDNDGLTDSINQSVTVTAGPSCSVTVDFESGIAGFSNSASATCSTGDFVIATPSQQINSGVTTQVGGDSTTGSGNALFTATNVSAGNADVDNGVCIVDSPIWAVNQQSTLSAQYFHGQRDTGDDPSGDFFRLELSLDGGSSFSPIVSIGDVQTDAAWTPVNANIPAGSQVQLRLSVADGVGPGDLVEGGIDDILICN